MAEYIEYHPLKFWLDPASIAEIVAHIQTYLVNNPINSTTEIETIIHDYLIAHPELIGGVDSVNGQTGEVVLTADNISAGENVTIKDVLDSLQDQIAEFVQKATEELEEKVETEGIGEVTRANCDFYEISGTNLVDAQNRIFTEGEYYSPYNGGFVKREGYSCIKNIKVTPGVTYYFLGTNAIEFDKNGNFLKDNPGNMGRSTSFTPSEDTDHVVLDYNGVPSGNIGGYKYIITTHNGTQIPVKVKDPDLLLQDSNFAEYPIPYGDVAKKAASPLRCGLMDEYGETVNISDCTITATNAEVFDAGDARFSKGSKAVRITKISDTNAEYKVTVTLPETINAKQWFLTYKCSYAFMDTDSGTVGRVTINSLTNAMFATNTAGLAEYWNCVPVHHGSAQNISSISISFTWRANAPVGKAVVIYLDSLTFGAKMKPTFILNFDQWWKESVDNGGYQYLFDNDIPFTMMTKNYDALNSDYLDLAMRAEQEYGCENSYYASYGYSNASLLNAATYSIAESQIASIKNDFITTFGHDCTSFGCTQMKLNKIDRTALINSGYKMIRGGGVWHVLDYYDNKSYWMPAFEISTRSKTLSNVKSQIDRTVSYGGCLLAFTHGINADGNDYMKLDDGTMSQSDGMNLTDFKAMVDYLVGLRNEGKIQICTMQDWYNQCIK